MDIDRVDDVATLKEIAKLLEAENRRLHRRLARIEGKPEREQLALEIARVEEQMAALQRRVYGQSSEKRKRVSAEAPSEAPPQRGHGPRGQPELPVVERDHDLDDKTCPACDGDLEAMGDQAEESDEITVVRRQFVVERHRRKKYRCRCNGAVVTAPGPRKLIAGGRYSVAFAVEVAVGKYLDHLPLERQVRTMARDGLVVDSQTLWDQINALAKPLGPTYEGLKAYLLSKSVLNADETWWRLMGKASPQKWWAWCLASEDAVAYRILPSRSKDAAKELVGDYQGVLVVDGYKAYNALARGSPNLSLVHCWAHVRRKFVEAEIFYPHCEEILDLIGELYGVDRMAPDPDACSDEARETALAARARVRDEHARPIVDKIRDWAYAQKAPRESALRKAVEYMLGLWPGLTRFLDDPRLPLDNNAVERALGSPVVGRRNHYASRSRRGTEVEELRRSSRRFPRTTVGRRR